MASNDDLERGIELEKQRLKLEEINRRATQDSIELKLQEVAALHAFGKSTATAADELTTLREARDREAVAIKTATDNIQKYTAALEKSVKQQVAADGELDKLLSSFTKTKTQLGGLVGRMSEGTFGFKNLAKSIVSPVKNLERLKDIGVKAIDMFVDFGIQQDEQIAKFREQTGAGDEFNEVIRDIALSNLQAGIGLEESVEAVKKLKNTFTDFTYASEEQQKTLAANSTLLDKVGMSFGTQAKVMQTATQAMGMSADESQVLLRDLASTAKSLGVDVDALGADFATNQDFIVRFGERGQEVFEEMAVAAKALGTNLGTLIEVTEKFKTFDGAARSVGRLNAILGGPFLNSIDMLNASYEDPIEGIKMLRDGFDQAGVSVEDLSGAELEAFASALGLSVTKTKELLGQSNEDLEIHRMNQEELAETARKAQSVMEQLSGAFNQLLADGKPIIDMFVTVIGWIGDFAGYIGSAEGALQKFMRVGIAAAGVMALIMAPLTMGTSLTVLGALGASLGIGAGIGGLALAAGSGTTAQSSAVGRFADGGVVQGSSMAMVGERGPEMVEMPTGTRVTTAPKTEQLTNAITKLISKLDNVGGGENIQLAVYIGKEKVDEIVVNAINSRAGRAAFSPFSNA